MTSLQRCMLAALAISAGLSQPAAAEPLSLSPTQGIASAPTYAPMMTTMPAATYPAPAENRRAPVNSGNLGGGFIEAIFGGPAAMTAPEPMSGDLGHEPRYGYAPTPAQPMPPTLAQPNPGSQMSMPPLSTPQVSTLQMPAPPMSMPAFPMPETTASVPQPAEAPDEIDPRYLKQEVAYTGSEPAGTIVVDTQARFLYLVEGSGRALRYGVGIGRPGFGWTGVKTISMKREWPDWRPPDEMLKRRPDLPSYMAGGPENPLGARALYLGSSLYRIHGSNEPWTIGTEVSSGCIRMRNEDVIDLYDRVKVGTKVIVL
jgi:lipoprotein-anchoring transpeptidase ErfK/SrfK